MRAARVHEYGSPDVISIDDVPTLEPAAGQLRVRVRSAGVGKWDALIREGSVRLEPLPIIIGSEISGVVDAIGSDVTDFKLGDEVYGATNPQFSGGYAEYAFASAGMMAQKPKSLNFIEAASVPIVAVTAWQMLFDYGRAAAGQSVFVLGAAGNVGAYAVQLATLFGLHVTDQNVDIVIDTVGGDAQQRSLEKLKPGGILVSAVSQLPEETQRRYGIRAAYFYVEVTNARLTKLTELFDSGKLATHVGTVLPFEKVRVAHEMLAGAPHPRGKIVLNVSE